MLINYSAQVMARKFSTHHPPPPFDNLLQAQSSKKPRLDKVKSIGYHLSYQPKHLEQRKLV